MTRHSYRPSGILALALASRGLAPTRIVHENEAAASSQFAAATTRLLALVLVAGVIALSLLQPSA
jgi:hypothetical protein